MVWTLESHEEVVTVMDSWCYPSIRQQKPRPFTERVGRQVSEEVSKFDDDLIKGI